MEYQSGVVSPTGSIEEGWQLIKDDYWTFFGMTAVALIIIIIASFIFGMINNVITMGISSAIGATTSGSHDAVQMSAAIVPQLIAMGAEFFANIIIATLSGVLFCGIYMALLRKANSGASDFNDLFAGFQKTKECLIVAVVVALLQFMIGIVVLTIGAVAGISTLGMGIMTQNGQLNPAVFGGLFLVILIIVLLSLVLNLIVSALTSFVYPLLAERQVSGIEALMLSAKGGLANLGRMILLLILLGLMMLGGLLACLIGALFVAPIATAAIFAAYQKVFGRMQDFRQYAPPAPPVFGNQPRF